MNIFKKLLLLIGKNICLIIVVVLAVFIFKKQEKMYNFVQQKTIELYQESALRFTAQEKLVEYLKTHQVNDENGSLKLIRLGRDFDGGYVVAEKSLEKADVLLGYGIADDNSFENQFAVKYNRPSYGFDCGVSTVKNNHELFTLVKECISNDGYLYNKSESNSNISSFDQQLDKLALKNKKIFIKMDIEGAEYDALDDVLKHHQNITGIALEIHFGNSQQIVRALHLLKQLSKDFVLIHVHGNNCCTATGFSTTSSIGVIPNVIELSYINKSLITHSILSPNQSHPQAIDQPNIEQKPDASFTILP